MDPIPKGVRRLWDIWDIRLLLLLSLILQIILFVLGNRRRYMTSTWIRVVIWLAYLMADWVAAVGLGKLSTAQLTGSAGSIADPNSALHGIWAPLLLLHLGGPDTITAYSMEDNQLWLRHFLAMGVQVVVAIYVILLCWRNSWFSILSIPMFMTGVIKYGERIWVLMKSASVDPERIAPVGDICIDYSNSNKMGHAFLYKFSLYPNFSVWDHGFLNYNRNVRHYFQMENWDSIEIAMGLMYDLLYTKTAITYTKAGSILRAISFSFTVSASVGFFWIMIYKEENLMREHYYSIVDIVVTGTLLIGALLLEMYAITVAISSDWMMIWLIDHEEEEEEEEEGKLSVIGFLFRKFPWLFSLHKKRWWSQSIGQFNLLSLAVKLKNPSITSDMLMMSKEVLNIFVGYEKKLDLHLKEYICQFINSSVSNSKEITGGQKGLEDHNELQEFIEKDLGARILIWHVATIVLLRDNIGATSSADQNNKEQYCYMKTSKLLSDYMFYLLVMCPSMLPIASGDLAFKYIKETIKKSWYKSIPSPKLWTFQDMCKNDPLMKKGYQIAQLLNIKEDKKWEILTSVWMEMLCYAANECDKNMHCQQLPQGGELLTLVWLLINIVTDKNLRR